MAKKCFSLIPVCTCLALVALNRPLHGQDAAAESVVVTGEEVPSAYGAPPGFSRAKFSNLTQAYVLPPWAFYFGEIYQGSAFRHGPPDHLFTQAGALGSPYRFGLAAEGTF